MNKHSHCLWIIPGSALVMLCITQNPLFLPGLTVGMLLVGVAYMMRRDWRARIAALPLWLGLAFTLLGDTFLVFRNAFVGSIDFIFGVIGFSFSQISWLCFSWKRGRFNKWVGIPLFSICCLFYVFILFPALRGTGLQFVVAIYAFLSCLNLSLFSGAQVTGKICLTSAIAVLLFSDTMIALGSMIYIGQVLVLVGPTYLISLVLMGIGAARFTLKYNVAGNVL